MRAVPPCPLSTNKARQSPSQKGRLRVDGFIRGLAVLCGLYLFMMPIVVVMAAHAIEPWSRQFWVRGIELLAIAISNAILCYAIWPTRAERFFLHFGSFGDAGASIAGGGGGVGHEFEELGLEAEAEALTVEAASV